MTTSNALRETSSVILSTNTPVALEFLGSFTMTSLIPGNNEVNFGTISSGFDLTVVSSSSVRLTSQISEAGFFSSSSGSSSNLLQIDTTTVDPPIYVRVRMRRIIKGDESWNGKLFFIETNGGANNNKRQFAPEPDWSQGWVTVVWDMTTPDAGTWLGLPDIGRLRFDFLTGGSSFGTVFDIASVIVDNGILQTDTVALPFALHSASDLLVSSVDLITKTETPLLLDAGYSVTVGDSPILTVLSNDALNQDLVARRLSSPHNELSLTGTTLPLVETNETFDRFANNHADLLGELDRCLKFSDGELTPSDQGKIAIPEDRKGNFLKYDDTTGELTHSPKLDGVPGPQGVQGEGATVNAIAADSGGSASGSAITISGSGQVNTSVVGDNITIDANLPALIGLSADMGGSTTTSTVSIAGSGLLSANRSTDTITITSDSLPVFANGSIPTGTNISTQRRLLSTATGTATTPTNYVVSDWPSTYRSIELEIIGCEQSTDSNGTISFWDATNNVVLTDSLYWTAGVRFEFGGGSFYFEDGSSIPSSFQHLSSIRCNSFSAIPASTFGIVGSYKITHRSNGLIHGKVSSMRMSSAIRAHELFEFSQVTALAAGVTHDGLRLEFKDLVTSAQNAFTGTVNLWGYPL